MLMMAFLPYRKPLVLLAEIGCTIIFSTESISVIVDVLIVMIRTGRGRCGATCRSLLLREHVLDAIGVAALQEAVFFLDLCGLGDLAARADHPEFWRRHGH